MIQKVLCPTDFSVPSGVARQLALGLARHVPPCLRGFLPMGSINAHAAHAELRVGGVVGRHPIVVHDADDGGKGGLGGGRCRRR